MCQKNDFGLFAAAFCAMLELLKGQEGRACLKCDTPKIKGGRFPVKQLISRRSFLKAAGVTAAAASMAIGAPAASACWFGDKSDVTILYTNDVHTYIDKQAPELTYAAIAALKQSYQNAGKKVLLVDAGDHVQESQRRLSNQFIVPYLLLFKILRKIT